MKIISTEFRDQEAISWENLKDFLNKSIYEEGFVVLSDDKQPNYIQMAEIETENGWKWGLEVRLYQSDAIFQHFRRFFNSPEEAIPVFKVIYYDENFDYNEPNWKDVTNEFTE
ncbi:hypothetical protein [Capnocytophaga canimorsus]|uniref:hypothetical protein n=1 Tax=Capnocytophaga canimorsus TaxID=28188 RepID=UPI000D6E348D|nr:hypothetical protein [Capnocytophaga canimorsus]AWL78733.1 hypothetical protein DKB58_07175 [Capnocytophaga canimorsus]AYW37343.1 hypothetical protein D8L92_08600 [Capnocytophaga canimorsus]